MALYIEHMIEIFNRITSIINNDSSSNIKIQIRNNRIKFSNRIADEWRDWFNNSRNYQLLDDLQYFLFGCDTHGNPRIGSILDYIILAKHDFKSCKMLSTISQPASLEEWTIKLDLLGV